MTSSNGNIFRVTGGPGEFPTQRPVTRSFDVFFDLRLNKRLCKQSWGWWFETLSWSLCRHCNENFTNWYGSYQSCIFPINTGPCLQLHPYCIFLYRLSYILHISCDSSLAMVWVIFWSIGLKTTSAEISVICTLCIELFLTSLWHNMNITVFRINNDLTVSSAAGSGHQQRKYQTSVILVLY